MIIIVASKGEIEMEYSIRYFVTDDENKVLKTFHGSVDEKKLGAFLQSLPKIIKDGTFAILNISRYNAEITCNLERYYKSESIKNKNYRILEYKVREEDIDDKAFLNVENNCSTNAYNIYVKWEESPAIINYIEQIDLFGHIFTMDFSLAHQLLEQVTSSEEQANKLLQQFMQCFTFNEVDQTSYDEVQLIFDAEQYPSLALQDITSSFRKAFENGKRNAKILNPNFKKEEVSLEIIPVKNEYILLIEKMKNERNAFGKYVNFLDGISDVESVFQYHSNRSFSLNCLSDEGDLYTYQVLISFPMLYEFMIHLNENYKVIKEETFQELDWDCYENSPILTKVLPKDIVANDAYRILDFSVEQDNIHIRTQRAVNVFVKWEESVALIQYINDFISSLTQKVQVDWSILAEKFDHLSVDEQEKKHLYNAFFRCFQFGEPMEIIPNDIISKIENHSSHPTLNLSRQKLILEKRKELGIRNREFFALLLENDIVSFPKQLVSKISKF